MIQAIIRKAMKRLTLKFSIKNLFPLINKGVVPVTVTWIEESLYISLILGFMTVSTNESILCEPMSATFKEILIVCPVESTKELSNPEESVSSLTYENMKLRSWLLGSA